jgi:hypothetical protein
MKHKIEIFSAGCKTCKDTIEAVRKLTGSDTRWWCMTCINTRLQAVPRSMASAAFLQS